MKKDTPRHVSQQTHKMHNGELSSRSYQGSALDTRLLDISKDLLPQYGDNWAVHNLVTLKRMALSRVIYYYELYQKILSVPGVICEFGVQWGATLALLQNLRGMYEPYNVSRKIFGFDSFEGFVTVDSKDGSFAKVGDYKSLPCCENILEEILSIHENFCPINHIKSMS
jgi:hypothetical protein